MFAEVVGRMSGLAGVRVREGVALLLSEWLLRCAVEWKEVSSRLMWARVNIEQESWVFIFSYEPGVRKSERRLKSSGMSSVVVHGDLNARVGN